MVDPLSSVLEIFKAQLVQILRRKEDGRKFEMEDLRYLGAKASPAQVSIALLNRVFRLLLVNSARRALAREWRATRTIGLQYTTQIF